MNEVPEQFTILGLGGAGCRILNELAVPAGELGVRLLAVDSDLAQLNATNVPPSNRLLLGGEWYKGLGCGGDRTTGQRAAGSARAALTELLRGTTFLLVVGGLGRGTLSGGAGVVQSIARRLEIPVAFQLTYPFANEGHTRRRNADTTLREELLPLAETVWCIPNDLLFTELPPTARLDEAFRLSDRSNAQVALALTAMLRHPGQLTVSAADFSALIKRRKNFCAVGVGTGSAAADGENRCLTAWEKVLSSPLLGGREKINTADAVVISLLGGNLTVGETKQALDVAAAMIPEHAQTLVGVGDVPAFGDLVRMTVMAVKFEVPAPDAPDNLSAPAVPARGRRGKVALPVADDPQGELPFDNFTKGIMEKTLPVIENGEDLDIPTYQRRRVMIDTGETK